MNKKVIVQVVQHLQPGGIETMALDLMHELSDRADVHILSLEGTASNAIAHWPRLDAKKDNLHFFDKAPGMNPQLIWRLHLKMRELNATSVHSHHIGPLFYGGFAAKLAQVESHVHTEHDAWHLNTNDNARLERWLIRTLRPTLVADCDAVAEDLLFHFPQSNPAIILNGIDTNRFVPVSEAKKREQRERLNLPIEGLIIGCAARLETVKGHKYLLHAISKTDDTILALAGDGSLRPSLQKLATKLGIAHRVHFLGAMDDVVPFYQSLDLFCLPSLNEGLPLSPLEAQSCGVPVIITDVGGCRSIVCPRSGCLTPPADSEALRQSILCFQYANQPPTPRQFVLRTGNLEKTARAYFNLLHPPVAEEC